MLRRCRSDCLYSASRCLFESVQASRSVSVTPVTPYLLILS